MYRLLFSFVLLAFVVAESPEEGPTEEEVRAELLAAGISPTAVAGITAVGDKYKTQLESVIEKGDEETARTLFEQIKDDTDAYMKTQSASDQAAYTAFVEKKKEEFEAKFSTEKKK